MKNTRNEKLDQKAYCKKKNKIDVLFFMSVSQEYSFIVFSSLLQSVKISKVSTVIVAEHKNIFDGTMNRKEHNNIIQWYGECKSHLQQSIIKLY